LNIVASGLAIVIPGFGTLNIGPFPFAAGSSLEASITPLDLGAGSQASWGPTGPGVPLGWRWFNNADPPGTISMRFENDDGGNHTVNYFIYQIGP
jgi:hypothetical protein